MSDLTNKFISNTYNLILQRSGIDNAEGEENPNLSGGLTNDSETIVNGVGRKIKGFILDVGNPSGATMGYGMYFQTNNHKNDGSYGIRLSSINERGQITSENKDILISTDNSTNGSQLEDKRRLILKGGIPGTMSTVINDEQIVGGSVGTQSQITLLLQGRLSVEHDYPIVLNDEQNQELSLMSGIFKGEGPDEYQVWSKVGNIVSVSGNWRWNPSGGFAGPTTVPMYEIEQNFTNYIFPVYVSGSPVTYDSLNGLFTISASGNYTLSGSIFIRYKRINVSGSFNDIFNVSSIRPNIIIEKNSTTIFQEDNYVSIPPTTPVPSSSVGQFSNWIEMPFSITDNFNINDTFELKYFIDTSYTILTDWYILTTQFEVEFGNNSYLKVNGATVSTMGNGNSIAQIPYSTDLRYPIINGKDIEKVWGVAKFRSETNPSGNIRMNSDVNSRSISGSFYQGNTQSISSLGSVDFSYTYLLDF